MSDNGHRNDDDCSRTTGSDSNGEGSSEEEHGMRPRKQDLFDMMERGNADQVRQILNQKRATDPNFDINATSKENSNKEYSALHGIQRLAHRLKYGHVEIVDILIEYGADVRSRNKYTKYTPLHIACFHKQLKVAERLIEVDKDHVHMDDREKYILLHYAAEFNDLPMMKLLMTIGSDSNCSPNSHLHTPLTMAAIEGRTSIVQALLDAGADMNKEEWCDQSPYGGINSALYKTCCAGHADVAKLLINRGASLDGTNRNGQNLLHTILDNFDTFHDEETLHEIIRLLVEKTEGFLVGGKDCGGRTPLHAASCASGTAQAIPYLIDNGADVDAIDVDGHSPLYYASMYGSFEKVQTLVAAGADINIVDSEEQTPVHAACRIGDLRVLRFLVAHGAIVRRNSNPSMSSPLYVAARYDDGVDIILELLAVHGVDVNEISEGCETALYTACDYGKLDTAKTLLRAGAKTDLTFMQIPLSTAILIENDDIVEMLLLYGANVHLQNEEDEYIERNTGETLLRHANKTCEDETIVESMIRRVT
eukprot:CAMPEP_0119572868 /NCGR_PEP_ID=MMETSP1352-20130426/44837_1 /TAXON_ID=265584 /ORGANISM="Stauroneis constricta, Strain CCMP1120" /LENGTH=535 /DNA_ID=CAMNT_0007622555 /DNA_START=125 /DNA_END=1730 /DNA_ORIENTATION=-